LILTIKPLFNKRGLWKFSAVAKVEDQVAAEAEIMCTMRDK
jgi:3-hydroxymyristoyl/3-hydroxydecanoyl-(acyl carrier protein) dehydratase